MPIYFIKDNVVEDDIKLQKSLEATKECMKKNNESVKSALSVTNEYANKLKQSTEKIEMQYANKLTNIDTHLSEVVDVVNRKSADVRLMGAIGDGKKHPISNLFSSLDEAKKIYPHANSLTDELDWCIIQESLNKYTYTFIPQGTYMLNQPLKMRFNTVLEGESLGTKFVLDETIDENSYIVTYGDHYSYGDYKGKIKNLEIHASNPNKACKGFYLNSGIELDNVTVYELRTFITKNINYIDRVVINRCNALYCSGTNEEYVIHLEGEGEGLEIKNLHLISAYLKHNYIEQSGIWIHKSKGGCISNSIINSGIKITDSSPIVITALHSEGSQHEEYRGANHQIKIQNSNVIINGMYKHKNLIGEDIVLSAVIGNSSHENAILELNNINIDVPSENIKYLNGDLYEISKTKNTLLKINNCYKTFNFSSKWTNTNEMLALKIKDNIFFNNNSTYLCRNSMIGINNKITNTCIDKCSEKISDKQFIYGSNNNPNLPCLKNSGVRFYYKIVLVLDVERNIAKIISAEDSATLSETGNLIRITEHCLLDEIGGILFLYRGIASGKYTELFKIPSLSCNYLFDFGSNIMGEFPQEADLAPIENFNITDDFKYINNNLNVEFTMNKPPVYGAFKKGDRCINLNLKSKENKSWIYNGEEWLSEGLY